MVVYDAGDFDRPHNRFVESLVTGGFVGIVTHLAVFATAGWFLLKKWWHHRGSFFPLAGLGLLVAYLVQLCTLFDHIISYHSILKFFQVDITGMFRMTSSARYFKDGVGSSRPNWR